jgi:hypothetical protein
VSVCCTGVMKDKELKLDGIEGAYTITRLRLIPHLMRSERKVRTSPLHPHLQLPQWPPCCLHRQSPRRVLVLNVIYVSIVGVQVVGV